MALETPNDGNLPDFLGPSQAAPLLHFQNTQNDLCDTLFSTLTAN